MAAARKQNPTQTHRSGWISPILLFGYAVPFSFSYTSLSAGTGALILFGAVQITMILSALRSGEKPHPLEWSGLLVAVAGLVYLVSPGLKAPSPVSSVLMVMAGVSWGLYSIRGRGTTSPLADTTHNFVFAVPAAVVINGVMHSQFRLTTPGMILAVISGGIASGMGYVIWYAALTGLSAMRAATVQLAVPVLAAAGGVLFLSEMISLRLLVSSIVILGGVGLALMGRQRTSLMKTDGKIGPGALRPMDGGQE